MRDRLTEEKTEAQAHAARRQARCPEWLEARIAPQGAKGGYAFLIETEDFSVKLLGEHIQNRPSVFMEMRSHALHPHPVGAAGACEAAMAWVRSHLYADQLTAAKDAISFTAAKPASVSAILSAWNPPAWGRASGRLDVDALACLERSRSPGA
jgi:hypothetical protein